jgi:glucokinase
MMAMRLLSGDIGGTKTILRLDQIDGDHVTTISESTYRSADFAHLNPMIEVFLATVDGAKPQVACLAIAGPIVNDTCKLTNLSWYLDGRQMEADLKIPTIRLINDFAAVGYGTLDLQASDLVVLQDQPRQAQASIALLGAGTGLGEALLVWQENRYQVLPIEGGHADFPARDPLEIGLLQYLQARYGRISVERVVSGQGIYAIYQYLRDTHFAPEADAVKAAMASQDPTAVVGQQALAGTDRLCTKALAMFVAAYGAEAGNLALKSLPYGGIYIAGGVAPKILPKLQDGLFLAHFLDKGRMTALLKQMRISVILNPKVGLIGAAYYAQRLLSEIQGKH